MPKNAETEVLAYCGTCKMDLMATIVAKAGSKIAKVQCKTCKKERAFKAPKGVTSPDQAPKGRKKKTAATADNGAAQRASVQAEWERLMKAAMGKSKKVNYTPRSQLTVGDILAHPTFGEGVVVKLSHPNKAEVIFQTDVKILIHSRM